MARELVYTSSARGLRDGTSGFCTVAMTRGMALTLVPRLEALGGYTAGPRGDGPVALSFSRLETPQGVVNVLTRVGPAQPDHTQRSNKLATYLVLGNDEQPEAGPAWLVAHVNMRDAWDGPPRWIEEPVKLPHAEQVALAPCTAWARACGDAGWAGVLVSAFMRDMSKPAHVIYNEGLDALALVQEAARLLPPWARWRATFSTYFLQPVAGAPCQWRFCLDGTPAADAARASKGLVIDVTRPMGAAADNRFVRAARSGVLDDADGNEARATAASARAGLALAGATSVDLARGDARAAGTVSGEAAAAPHDSGHYPELGLEPEAPSPRPTWAQRIRWDRDDKRSAPAAAPGGALLRRALGASPAAVGGLVAVGTVLLVVTLALVMSSGSSTPPAKALSRDAGQRAVVQTPREGSTRPAEHATTTAPDVPSSPAAAAPNHAVAPASVPTEPTAPASAPALATAPPPSGDVPTSAEDAVAGAALPTAVPTDDVRSLLLHFKASPAGLMAECPINPLWGGATARFVPPSALQAIGVVAVEETMQLPGGAPSARIMVGESALQVLLPVAGKTLEALAPVVKPAPTTKPLDYGRALLRRVPIELLDKNGVVVARARVEPELTVVGALGGQPSRVVLPVRELALQAEVWQETRGNKTLLGSGIVNFGVTTQVKGRVGTLLFTFDDVHGITVTPEPISAASGERTRLAAELKLWSERAQAGRTLQSRVEGKSIPDGDLVRALDVLEKSLTQDEKLLAKDEKGVTRALSEGDTLRRVLPPYTARCESEVARARDAVAAAARTAASAQEGVVRVNVLGTDGMLLAVLYPEGRLK